MIGTRRAGGVAVGLVVLAAIAALALAAPAVAGKPPTKAQAFQAYIKKMQPVGDSLLRAEALIDVARLSLQLYEATEDAEDLAEAISALRDARDFLVKARATVRKIKPPAGFAEPHNGVAAAALREASAARVFADKLETGADLTLPRIHFDAVHDVALDDYKQWRTETIVQLRRYGLVVPRWVKEFGT